jgi:hypothetical protein
MGDLVTLHPAIFHLDGLTVLRGVVDTIREVYQQWQ